MKKMIHIYSGILLSYKKINVILPFPTAYMDLEGSMLSKISQSGKDKCNMISLICVIQRTI